MRRDIDSYLTEVSNQIKSKKAKKMVEAELRYHIDQKKQYWIQYGLDEREAEEKAVQEMGSPFTVGNEFNKLHSPKHILLFKPIFIHVLISMLAAIVFTLIGSFDMLMINDLSRNVIYVIETIVAINLYWFFGRKYLKNIASNIIIISTSIIFAINLSLGLSGYLMMNLGSGIVAENGQLPIMVLMLFNYGVNSISSLTFLPSWLGLLLICSVSPLLLYLGSKSGSKLKLN
ncbi:hypothetical protein CIB95_02150 [Lottiidibacillus patelloidae]|uniref:Uncharacterized protein n=1 Tax=Lottiidibacillus patelloidae TaxID=2670334 RepID=A0A263BXC5_9BACI|nr:permease prefix domain 1-containing protein [Lottiidibacillus patelloidae]OZM58393.1 hypothetical protein CIB95_02150 [Lottiidibacillus patelloidae]